MTSQALRSAHASLFALAAALGLSAGCSEPAECFPIGTSSLVQLRFTSSASLDGASVKVCAANARFPNSLCAAGAVHSAMTIGQGFLAITGPGAAQSDAPYVQARLETRAGAAPTSTLEITWVWRSDSGLRDGDLFHVDIVAGDGGVLFSGDRTVNYDEVLPDCGGSVRGEIVLVP